MYTIISWRSTWYTRDHLVKIPTFISWMFLRWRTYPKRPCDTPEITPIMSTLTSPEHHIIQSYKTHVWQTEQWFDEWNGEMKLWNSFSLKSCSVLCFCVCVSVSFFMNPIRCINPVLIWVPFRNKVLLHLEMCAGPSFNTHRSRPFGMMFAHLFSWVQLSLIHSFLQEYVDGYCINQLLIFVIYSYSFSRRSYPKQILSTR